MPIVNIRCITLDGGILYATKYKGPSGKEYLFHKGSGTPIEDREDAEYFLNCGDGNLFKVQDKDKELIYDTKKGIAEVIKVLPTKKKPKEEVKKEEPKTEEKSVEKEEPKPEVKKQPEPEVKKENVKRYTKTELINMSKKKQINLLRELGATKFPGLERDRVDLILKLQGGR